MNGDEMINGHTGDATDRKMLESEYTHLKEVELELSKTRWTVFMTLLSISFLVAGIVLKQEVPRPAVGTLIGALAFVVYAVGFFHYWWFHKLAHALRERLCKLEDPLHYDIYRLREKTRPRAFGRPVRFHWVIYLLSSAYAVLLLSLLWLRRE